MTILDPIRRLGRRAKVRAGLARIGAYERLGQRRAGRWTAPVRRREDRHAQRSVTPLEKWPRISPSSYATYTAGPNLVRIDRLVELIRPSRRILDIGIGFGYVTGILLREASPDHYCGVDLKPLFLEATRSMLETSGLGDRICELEVLNIFDIDSEFAEKHDPDLVLVLEVLEHVEDPAGALAAVSAVVRPGTEIMFTVPLRGRLDGVWGHLSRFDRRRLEAICAKVGLEITRAEPLCNTWSLIVARTGKRSPTPGADGMLERYTFRPALIRADAELHRRPGELAEVKLESTLAYLRCEIGVGGEAGGVRFETPAPEVARIEFEFAPPDRAQRIAIRGIGDDGSVRMEWQAEGISRALGERRTYVLVPGEPARGMQHAGDTDPSGVRWLEVVVEPEPGAELTLTVYRVAYLGDPVTVERVGPPRTAASAG